MNFSKQNPHEKKESADFALLMQVVLEDPDFMGKLKNILEMGSFNRRSVLTMWLELLRIRKTHKQVIDALSILFDDRTAAKMLMLLGKDEKFNSVPKGYKV